MTTLVYASNSSLDGWTEDATGDLAWAPMNEEVFVDITQVMATARTYLYGRKMYETLAPWETDPALGGQSDTYRRYADVWSSAEKVVYTTTLAEPTTERTRIERAFDPEAARAVKEAATDGLLVGGPHLAAQAFDAGLVDEVVLWVWPIVLGGQNAALQGSGRMDFALLDERHFANGVVRLHYRVT